MNIAELKTGDVVDYKRNGYIGSIEARVIYVAADRVGLRVDGFRRPIKVKPCRILRKREAT